MMNDSNNCGVGPELRYHFLGPTSAGQPIQTRIVSIQRCADDESCGSHVTASWNVSHVEGHVHVPRTSRAHMCGRGPLHDMSVTPLASAFTPLVIFRT